MELMEDSQGDYPDYQLIWKGTFIDACEIGGDDSTDLSPRASSDPGSTSSSYSCHFSVEHAYISSLSSKLSKRSLWNSNLDFADSGDVSDGMASEANHETLSPHSKLATSSASASSTDNPLDTGSSTPGSTEKKMQLHRDELKMCMRRRAVEITDQRFSNALTSIQEIPEQVGEVFNQTATDLIDEVTNEVSKARQLIAAKVEDPETSTDVATQVQEIPDMVMASFEVSFAKAMSNVRDHVRDVIRVLEGSGMESEAVVQHLWAIPEEVRQITRIAVKEASETSQDKVVEQLDHVLRNISEEEKTDAFFQAKESIVNALPQTLPETVRRIGEVINHNVRHATGLVVERGMGDCGYVANRVVADTLLRAKTGDSLQDFVLDNPGNKGHPELCSLQDPVLDNPGSRGHPELCSRACLYYPLGTCTNGMNCQFCHAQHSKRSTHLDKRHREMFRAMEFNERFRLILPILKTKLEGVDTQRDLCDSVSALLESLGQVSLAIHADKKRAKEIRTLQAALKFMSVRSLAALLYRAPIPGDAVEYQAVENFYNMIRPSLASRPDASRLSSQPSDPNSRKNEFEFDL